MQALAESIVRAFFPDGQPLVLTILVGVVLAALGGVTAVTAWAGKSALIGAWSGAIAVLYPWPPLVAHLLAEVASPSASVNAGGVTTPKVFARVGPPRLIEVMSRPDGRQRILIKVGDRLSKREARAVWRIVDARIAAWATIDGAEREALALEALAGAPVEIDLP